MDHDYFMKKALDQARHALDAGDFPVGCVLVGDGKVLATGMRLGTSQDAPNEVDHAEMNALRQLAETTAPTGALTAYCTMEPCLMCFGALIISGVKTIVYAYEDAMGGATACDLSRLAPLYQQADVTIVPHVMRAESLAFFKAFFQNPQNQYWPDSLLAQYTLDQ
jgi:tRNA(adenine34) deaminase